MKTLLAKLFGKYIAGKIQLEDGKMEDTKKWYKSRVIWAGVVSVILAAYNEASVKFGIPAIPDFVFAILGAIGVYARSTTTTKIG